MKFFFELIKEYHIDFPYHTIKDYIINTYHDGEIIYNQWLKKYDSEIKIYQPKDKSFEEIFGDTIFI